MKMDSATGKSIANDGGSVQFPCPKCQDSTIVRSKQSRQIVVQYTCEKCGFVGPN